MSTFRLLLSNKLRSQNCKLTRSYRNIYIQPPNVTLGKRCLQALDHWWLKLLRYKMLDVWFDMEWKVSDDRKALYHQWLGSPRKYTLDSNRHQSCICLKWSPISVSIPGAPVLKMYILQFSTEALNRDRSSYALLYPLEHIRTGSDVCHDRKVRNSLITMNISTRENLHMVRIRLKNHCQMGLSLLEMTVMILFVGKTNLQEIETSSSNNQVNMIGFG